MSGRPLDLRLLPGALGAWAAAAAAVHLPATPALRLGAVLLLGALLLAALLLAVLRLLPDPAGSGGGDPAEVSPGSEAPGERGDPDVRAEARLRPSAPGARARLAAVHLVLGCALAGAVALTAGLEQRDHQQSGWAESVEQRAPQTLILRVAGAPQQISSAGFDAEPRAVVDVEVLAREEPGRRELDGQELDADASAGGDEPRGGLAEVRRLRVDASAVLMLPADDAAAVRHGERLRGMMRSSPAEPGDRAGAVLTPFGEAPQQMPADAWTRLWRAAEQMRESATRAAASAPGEAPQLLPGMILGDRSGQSSELTEAMRDAGLSHLTAVSGANCALILGTVLALLRLLRLPRWCTPPAALISLLLFVLLVHPEPSVIRAAVMGGIGATALFAGRGRSAFSLLCVCVILLLILDPWYAVEPAFALSAAATAGIVLIGTPLQRMLAAWLPRWAASVLALACAAQLAVTPLLVPLAEGMNLYAIPANVLAAPLVPLVTVPGTAAAVLSPWLPAVAEAVLWCCGIPAALIAALGRVTADLPQAVVPWPEGWIGAAVTVLYMLAAVVLIRALVTARWGPRSLAVLTAAAAALTALVVPVQSVPGVGDLLGPVLGAEELDEQWRIAQCDVGQGDMLVLRTGEAEAIVVDAGPAPGPADDCLQRLGISAIRVLMISHEHRDHWGGASGVAEDRPVQQVLYSASRGWNAAEQLDLGEVPIRRAQPGMQRRITGRRPMEWTVLRADDHHPEANDNSMVVSFALQPPDDAGADADTDAEARALQDPVDVLTMGDLEAGAAARALRAGQLPEDVDLLKVSHHGARNGGVEVIRARRPEAAVISVGAENSYGHPAAETLRALQSVGSRIYRTDEHGTVVFSLQDDTLQARSLP